MDFLTGKPLSDTIYDTLFKAEKELIFSWVITSKTISLSNTSITPNCIFSLGLVKTSATKSVVSSGKK